MPDVDVIGILRTGMHLHQTDQYQAAHDHYRMVLNHDPNNVHALHLLGVILLQNGFGDLGRSLIEQALSLSGDYPEARMNLASFGCSLPAKYAAEIKEIDKKPPEWPIFDNTTTGMWRMQRMVEFASCFSDEDASWLTIGDAYGHDSLLLRERGIRQVVASNLNTGLLKRGHEQGAIGDYLEINAETISLPDESFDYVLCKEAMHHMPRPMLAVYEMLRVARKGVFLIEPQDPVIDWRAKKGDTFWHEISENMVSFGRVGEDSAISSQKIDWYEDGAFNYVYTLSQREIRKLCYGVGVPAFAWKEFNDYYNAEWADQPAGDSEGYRGTVEQMQLWDQLCAISGKPCGYLTGMLFKRVPEQGLVQKLHALGFVFNRTPTRFLPLKWPA